MNEGAYEEFQNGLIYHFWKTLLVFSGWICRWLAPLARVRKEKGVLGLNIHWSVKKGFTTYRFEGMSQENDTVLPVLASINEHKVEEMTWPPCSLSCVFIALSWETGKLRLCPWTEKSQTWWRMSWPLSCEDYVHHPDFLDWLCKWYLYLLVNLTPSFQTRFVIIKKSKSQYFPFRVLSELFFSARTISQVKIFDVRIFFLPCERGDWKIHY